MKYVAVREVDNDILIQGDGCITSLSDLYSILVEPDATEIEIRADFVKEYFTYTALCDFVENAASVVPNVRVWVADTIYDGVMSAVKDIESYKEPAEFIYALEHNPNRVISTVQTLCKSYITANEESAVANNKIATMLVQIDDLQRQLSDAKSDNKRLYDLANDTHAKLHALVSRVNFKYEKTVKPDALFLANENKYNRILYLKELTRVHYTDTLVYYLKEILKTLYSAPVRSVVIEPYYSYGKEILYPEYTPHWELTYQDVYSGDILMAGYQPKLMKDILQNSNHVHYLIVLDRGGYRTPHITGSNVSTIYLASDTKDVPDNIPSNSVITYDASALNIPYIDNFEALSIEDKIQKYSSMPVVKELIKILEEGK